jgi:prepilin-type N-terminal cleavage/methylation domain-containing protein
MMSDTKKLESSLHKDSWAMLKLQGQPQVGFTLLETLIVLLMLGILVMLSWPQLSSALVEARLSGAAEEVVNAIEYAQLTSMTSGRNTKVEINDASNKIDLKYYKSSADLFTGGDVLLASGVESGSYQLMLHPLKKGFEYQILLNNEHRFSGIEIIQSDFKSDTPVYFDSLGAPSHGGTVTLALGSRQIVVTLDDLTGKVTMSN